MPTDTPDLNHLQLTIQRLVDADLLLEDEAAPLLAEVEAALRSPGAAEPEAIGRLVERLAPLTSSLVSSNLPDTRAVAKSLAPAPTTASHPPTSDGNPARQARPLAS